MNRLYIFIIRAVFGAGFAVLVTRIFYPKASLEHIIGLGIFLVGMAYLAEYFRNRRQD
ncbi:MAG: hypothetical protein JSV38_01095 [Desulfobacterales bacterium]|nr:MAG: hypothetical protein JSV38_01095 [Desulfobacterales bacterium]